MESILSEIPALVDAIGFFQTAVLTLAMVFAIVVAKERFVGGKTAKEAAADVIAPMTCAFGDIDRDRLERLIKSADHAEDRLERVEREIVRISALLSRKD